MRKILFKRQVKQYHFILWDSSRTKWLTTISEAHAPFSVGDCIRITEGKYKGIYEIKGCNAYSNVECVKLD